MSEEKKTWYDPKHNKAVYKYKKENWKRVPFDVPKIFYDDKIKPAADSMGLPVNTFLRQAIESYIEKLQEENK